MEIINNNKDNSFPNMDSLMNSIKAINRAVPMVADGAYSYFTDSLTMGSTIAKNIDKQITDSLTNLPTSIEKLKSIEEFAKNISKINEAEKTGQIDSQNAAKGRAQLQERMNEGLSFIITSFDDKANDLSDLAERLSKYCKTVELRLKEANSTEAANHERAKSDEERESARVDTLQVRYDKLKEAVDEKRGGPVDELLAVIPDEKELSGLLDVGAEDAAAPEVAAAKKAIELAVAQLKKFLESMGKTIEFMQLAKMRDEVFKALQEQRKVSTAASDRLRAASKTLDELNIIQSAGEAMGTTAEEVDKIVPTFSTFVKDLKKLDGQEITNDSVSNLYNSMSSYLKQVSLAKNNVILS